MKESHIRVYFTDINAENVTKAYRVKSEYLPKHGEGVSIHFPMIKPWYRVTHIKTISERHFDEYLGEEEFLVAIKNIVKDKK